MAGNGQDSALTAKGRGSDTKISLFIGENVTYFFSIGCYIQSRGQLLFLSPQPTHATRQDAAVARGQYRRTSMARWAEGGASHPGRDKYETAQDGKAHGHCNQDVNQGRWELAPKGRDGHTRR